jgi:hypothetical protein
MSNNKPAKTVFISYAREDFESAKRLYNDLKKAGLAPWLDKYTILPGQNWKDKIKDAIKNSRYFIPIFSSTSIKKIGVIQTEYKFALDYADRYPPGMIFAIPVRLDDCKIPYSNLQDIHHVDLFPNNKWKEGINSILQAIEYSYNNHQDVDNNENNDVVKKKIMEKILEIMAI